MNDQEAHDFYADPANLVAHGPGRKHPKDLLTEVLSARISPSMLNQVTASAAAENRSAGSWVREALRKELQRRRVAAKERDKPQTLPSSLSLLPGRTFTCPHLSIGNVTWARCEICGVLEAAA